jgi:hypothetical protein
MKTIWAILLLSAWIPGGCLTLPARWVDGKPPPAAPGATITIGTRTPITQDQVTEENARQLADALLEELDQEAQEVKPGKQEKP